MSWQEGIAAIIGPAGGAAALAATIYAGSGVLEANMRKEALREIADFVSNKSTRRLPDAQVAANFVHQEFETIFGKRHFSWKCFKRSLMASCIVILVTFVYYFSKHQDALNLFEQAKLYRGVKNVDAVGFLIGVGIGLLLLLFFTSIIPDYVSLWKGRWILRRIAIHATTPKIFLMVSMDILASILISISTIVLIAWAVTFISSGESVNLGLAFKTIVKIFEYYLFGGLETAGFNERNHLMSIIFSSFIFGTAVTSIWTLLALVSCLVTKMFSSVDLAMHAIRAIFDVEEHPVKVLGLTAAVLVWTGSVVYAAI